MGRKKDQIMKDKKKRSYEEPEFLILGITDDVITESFGNSPPDVNESETDNDSWGSGFMPF